MKDKIEKIKSSIFANFRGLDRPILRSIFILILFGALLTLAASPAVAERNNLDSYHFIKRQFLFLPVAIVVMLGVSMLTVQQIRRVALCILLVSITGMICVLLFGHEIKGAKRWLNIWKIGWQPSEFVKPTFAVICAWLIAVGKLIHRFPGRSMACILYGIIALLLVKQPDVGMFLTITAIFGIELFLSGIRKIYVVGLTGIGAWFLMLTYFCFDHVRMRVDSFLNPEKGEAYQVEKSLETLKNAGWFGTGPGEGVVKSKLPDAHTDFILAVSAEEFGFILSFILICVFTLIVLRGFTLIRKENNYFCQLAVAGLLTQIAFQVIVNMGSTLNLLPPKGMTLPFISYGGSSLVSVGLCFGFVLGLMQRKTLSKGLD